MFKTYQHCITACLNCMTACNHCAASSIKEENLYMMARCIQLDMECAAICYAAAQLMSLESDQTAFACEICAAICEACAIECENHAAEHCRECAAACRLCADECRKIQHN